MRINLKLSLLIIAIACSNAHSQQNDLSSFLSDFKSPDVNKRSAAYTKIAADKEALKRPEVQAALFELLDRENQRLRKPAKESDSYDEGSAEYVANLTDTAESFVGWHNQRLVCILAQSPYEPDSQFASDLVTKAGVTILPCLLKMSHDNFVDRYQSIPLLVHFGASAGEVSPAIHKQVQDAIMSGLRDSSVIVRQGTVEAIGKYGKQDMIPVLQKIAESDPVSRRLDNGQLYFTVRESAIKAIQAIQERAKAK